MGIQVRRPTPPHNYEVTWDGTRHFANGYGDNNPLWCDPEYGKSTRWGGLIGPPNFLYTMGEHDAPELTADRAKTVTACSTPFGITEFCGGLDQGTAA